MKLPHLLIFFLFFSCQTNTAKKPTQIDSSNNLMMDSEYFDIQPKAQVENNDSIYKIGDYLFEADKNLAFDFFQNGHQPNQLKSNGDTLYSDSLYTILADYKKVDGAVYKKYVPKYKFDDYKVYKKYTGCLAKPNFLTDPSAREYKTNIQERCFDSAINFAGHYTIAQWSCGTECLMMAVVDRTNGRIFYSTNYLPFDTADGHWGVDYRKDSKLIIVNSYLLADYPGYIMQLDWIKQSWRKLSFYKWKGNGFVKLD